MKLPPVPGPKDVLATAVGVRELVSESLALVPRMIAAVGQIERLLGRVAAVLDQIEAVTDRAEDAVAGAIETTAQAEAVAAEVAATTLRAEAVVAAAEATTVRSEVVVAAAEATTLSADALLGRSSELLQLTHPIVAAYRPALLTIAPLLDRFAQDLDAAEIDALIELVNRLPTLSRTLDEDVLPVLAAAGQVAPDVHGLLETVAALRELANGFPGSKLFRRRGHEEITGEEEAAEGDGTDQT